LAFNGEAPLIQVNVDGDSISRIPPLIQVIAVVGVIDIDVVIVISADLYSWWAGRDTVVISTSTIFGTD
jgi:hypothetical protein